MKKTLFLSLALLLGISVATAQTPREERQAASAAQQAADYEAAVQAINDRQFILEANRIQSARGRTITVVPTFNFFLVDGDQAIVQFILPNTGGGMNGSGGITMAGRITGVSSNTNRRGNVTTQYSVQGNGMSFTVTLSMASGGNFATARVSSTFSNARFTLLGNVIPGGRSDVFKGRSFQNIPRGLM